jgi:hypothetical protein
MRHRIRRVSKTTVSCAGDSEMFIHAADRVTKSGRKTQRALGAGLFDKELSAALPDVRPGFVSGARLARTSRN